MIAAFQLQKNPRRFADCYTENRDNIDQKRNIKQVILNRDQIYIYTLTLLFLVDVWKTKNWKSIFRTVHFTSSRPAAANL